MARRPAEGDLERRAGRGGWESRRVTPAPPARTTASRRRRSPRHILAGSGRWPACQPPSRRRTWRRYPPIARNAASKKRRDERQRRDRGVPETEAHGDVGHLHAVDHREQRQHLAFFRRSVLDRLDQGVARHLARLDGDRHRVELVVVVAGRAGPVTHDHHFGVHGDRPTGRHRQPARHALDDVRVLCRHREGGRLQGHLDREQNAGHVRHPHRDRGLRHRGRYRRGRHRLQLGHPDVRPRRGLQDDSRAHPRGRNRRGERRPSPSTSATPRARPSRTALPPAPSTTTTSRLPSSSSSPTPRRRRERRPSSPSP